MVINIRSLYCVWLCGPIDCQASLSINFNYWNWTYFPHSGDLCWWTLCLLHLLHWLREFVVPLGNHKRVQVKWKCRYSRRAKILKLAPEARILGEYQKLVFALEAQDSLPSEPQKLATMNSIKYYVAPTPTQIFLLLKNINDQSDLINKS